jgi:hypothetical protein
MARGVHCLFVSGTFAAANVPVTHFLRSLWDRAGSDPLRNVESSIIVWPYAKSRRDMRYYTLEGDYRSTRPPSCGGARRQGGHATGVTGPGTRPERGGGPPHREDLMSQHFPRLPLTRPLRVDTYVNCDAATSTARPPARRLSTIAGSRPPLSSSSPGTRRGASSAVLTPSSRSPPPQTPTTARSTETWPVARHRPRSRPAWPFSSRGPTLPATVSPALTGRCSQTSTDGPASNSR